MSIFTLLFLISARLNVIQHPLAEHRGGVAKQILHKAVSLGVGAGTTYLHAVAPSSIVARPLISLATDKLKKKLHKGINQFGEKVPDNESGEVDEGQSEARQDEGKVIVLYIYDDYHRI